MKILGRLLVRENKVVGIYIPFANSGLESGIYNLVEYLGEMQIEYVGKPAMSDACYNGLDLMGLHARIAEAGMTQEELNGVCQFESYRKAQD